MSSPLYDKAVAALDEPGAWAAARDSISGVVSLDEFLHGAAVICAVEEERQLSADPAKPDLVWMCGFLAELSAAIPATGEADAIRMAYEAVCSQYAGRGAGQSSTPAALFRYFVNSGFWRQLAKLLGPDDQPRLLVLIATADAEASRQAWDDVLRFVQAIWLQIPRAEVRLAKGPTAFVTFEAGQLAERDDGPWMVDALALRQCTRGCLIEMGFALQESDVLQFPTCADAGWYGPFRSAEAGEQHGWSRPHSGDPGRRQPEAVMLTPSLARVAAPGVRMVPGF